MSSYYFVFLAFVPEFEGLLSIVTLEDVDILDSDFISLHIILEFEPRVRLILIQQIVDSLVIKLDVLDTDANFACWVLISFMLHHFEQVSNAPWNQAFVWARRAD